MSAPRPPASRFVFRLPRETWKVIAIAFALGVLLFVLAWWVARRHDASATAVPAVTQSATPLAPLPAPLAGGGDGAADMPEAKSGEAVPDDAVPTLPETSSTAGSSPTQTTPDAPAPAPIATPVAPDDRPLPIQGQMRAPLYPAAALRRGESGKVVIRVDVDANGSPGGVTLLKRSGSRELDRAAMEAVRGWRFQPARRNGQAVPGSIDVPFEFKPGR